MRILGVDVGKRRHFASFVDLETRELVLAPRPLDRTELLGWARELRPDRVVIDAPDGPNLGIFAATAESHRRHEIQTDCRMAEFRLYISGVYATPRFRPARESSRGWMVAGFDLYHAFHEELGLSIDHGSGEGQLFETHPTYAFKASLGWQLTSDPTFGERIICDPRRALRPKGTESGRAQRIALIVLFSEEIGIALAEGSLGRMQQRIDWADAALCSVLGAWLDAFPAETRAFGDQREGSIWLRLPQSPFSIGHQISATAEEAISPPGLVKDGPIADAKRGKPRLEITSASPRHPNAYVLRLGNSGPAGLSQAEALERLFAAAANRSELWFAINISNLGQLRKVSSRLIDDCWKFCASWNESIRFVARVSKVVTSDEPRPAPSVRSQQAWTKNGRIGQARCWVQLAPESFEEVLWTQAEILTWQDTEWRPGFPKNQTALLRAIVPL